jgi:hypothetical protein
MTTRRRPSGYLPASRVAMLVGLTAAAAPSVSRAGAHDAICSRDVALVGDAELVRTVASALAVRGIRRSQPGSDCSPLRVRIERRVHSVRLEIRRGDGSRVGRVVRTPDTAAVLVESWLRTDIAAPLLAARTITEPARAIAEPGQPEPAPAAAAATPVAPMPPAPPPPPAALPPPAPHLLASLPPPAAPALDASMAALLSPPPGPGATAVVEQSSAPAVAAERLGPPRSGSSLTVGGEGAMSRDGSQWMGAVAEGCLRMGALCVGVIGRYVSTMNSEDATLADGDKVHEECMGAAGLVAANVSIPVGRVLLRPGAAVGMGWVRASTSKSNSSGALQNQHDINTTGMRAEARLAIDLPLSRALALDLALSGGLGEGAESIHSTGVSGGGRNNNMPEYTLSSTPALLVRGAVGVRFGAR